MKVVDDKLMHLCQRLVPRTEKSTPWHCNKRENESHGMYGRHDVVPVGYLG
jgi:hypothetical protein